MKRNTYSREELEDTVKSYLEMRQKEINGESFIKKKYYQELAKKFSRPEKSYEFKMQNISYVFSVAGRDWIKGLKPLKNVGVNVAKAIEEIIADFENRTPNEYFAFQIKVSDALKKPKTKPPIGSRKPKKSKTASTKYERDHEVAAWVTHFAKGICESCNQPAPFQRQNKTPFLEVHHLKQLADGGTDTITNAIAVCPNCHRELHFGENKINKKIEIYKSIKRLIQE